MILSSVASADGAACRVDKCVGARHSIACDSSSATRRAFSARKTASSSNAVTESTLIARVARGVPGANPAPSWIRRMESARQPLQPARLACSSLARNASSDFRITAPERLAPCNRCITSNPRRRTPTHNGCCNSWCAFSSTSAIRVYQPAPLHATRQRRLRQADGDLLARVIGNRTATADRVLGLVAADHHVADAPCGLRKSSRVNSGASSDQPSPNACISCSLCRPTCHALVGRPYSISRNRVSDFCPRTVTRVSQPELARLAGFEPTTPAFGGRYSIQLSYRRVL